MQLIGNHNQHTRIVINAQASLENVPTFHSQGNLLISKQASMYLFKKKAPKKSPMTNLL